MVTITPTPLLSVDLPTDEQAEELLRRVVAVYPQLRRPETVDPFTHKHQFERAMRYCAYVRREEQPQTGYYFSYWLDDAREFLDHHGYIGGVGLQSFVSAIVASGIVFAPLDNFPHDLAFGLGRGEAARPSAAWRDSLRNIPQPVIPRNRVTAPRRVNLDVKIRHDD